MRVALDTNAYTDFAKGDATRRQVVFGATELFVPLIVLGELRAGFLAGNRPAHNDAILSRFLALPHVSVLAPDDATTHEYAKLYVQLRRQGTPIPTNDTWIAAVVLQHGLVLCTSDRHFAHLPQVSTC